MGTQNFDIPGVNIEAVLSEHEHADVYRVKYQDSTSFQALKIAKTVLGAKQVIKEVALLKQFVATPGVVACIDSGVYNGMPYFCMPLHKATLHQFLNERKSPLGYAEALGILSQLAETLSNVHQQGILHGDLHPRNIVQDADSRWQLIDFAAAIDVKQEHFLNAQRERLGTPLYASPEQREGLTQLSVESDVYALSSIMCAILSGELHQNLLRAEHLEGLSDTSQPEIQLSFSALIHSAQEQWLSAPQISQNAGLESVLRTGLDETPNKRYSSVQNLLLAMQKACSELVEPIKQGAPKNKAFADATVQFTSNVAFSEDIQQIKQTLMQGLLLDGQVSEKAISDIIMRYQLDTKISLPHKVLQSLVQEATVFLKQDPKHAAFLSWSQHLHAYALTYGTSISRKSAKKFVEQGIHQGAGDALRLQNWLYRHFSVQSWVSENKAAVFAVMAVFGLLTFVWYPNHPLIYEQSDSAGAQSANELVADTQNIQKQNNKEGVVTASALQGKRAYIQPSKRFVQPETRLLELPLSAEVEHSANQQKVTLSDEQGTISYTLRDTKTNALFYLNFHRVIRATPVTSAPALQNVTSLYVMSEEVSQGIWLACVNAGRCRQAKALSTSAERRSMLNLEHPVVNVNWYDITEDFIPYLNETLSTQFALPTMAQWLTFAFSPEGKALWANTVHCQNCQSENSQFANSTMPTNGLPPGPFSLHHVYGNAQEWLQDCWQDVKLGLQRCDQAPAVGGAWMDTKQSIEQQPLSRLLKTARSMTTGFRLVKRETTD